MENLIKRLLIRIAVSIIAILLLPLSALAAEETMDITVNKDKFIDKDGGYTSYQNGSNAWLYVGYDPTYGLQESAMGFDLSSMPDNIQSIKLRLPVYYVNNSALFNLYGSNYDGWNEYDDYMPNGDHSILSETIPAYNGSSGTLWKEVDVTSFVNSQISADNMLHFY